jgi:AcrR family transcriptional regulator
MSQIEAIYLRKKPKQDRSQTTVDALVEATARILVRDGPERLSTNRIAEVAGVSIGSLYQYFPNKEALLEELRRRYQTQFLDRVMAQVSHLGPLPLHEAVGAFTAFMIGIHREDPELHNAVSAQVPEWERKFIHQVTLAYLEAHRDEVRPQNLDLAAFIVEQAGEATIHNAALYCPERLDDPEFAEEVTRLLLGYLAK